MKIYKTESPWDKKKGVLADHIGNKKNIFSTLKAKADKLLSKNKSKVFVITPIQGNKYGDQEDQRILREYNERFEVIEGIIADFGGIAIRIDREQTLDELVSTIKKEIRNSIFVIADLTDERQSCYFEAGYAEALGKPLIYISSPNSVMNPGTKTKIHFDIHMNVQYFTNHTELKEKLESVININRLKLFPDERQSSTSGDIIIS